jgi:hypothetical protein
MLPPTEEPLRAIVATMPTQVGPIGQTSRPMDIGACSITLRQTAGMAGSRRYTSAST